MPFGTSELVIVLLIIVVVFGSTKLPQLGDGLGRAIKNFKRAVTNPNEVDVTPKKPELPPERRPRTRARKQTATVLQPRLASPPSQHERSKLVGPPSENAHHLAGLKSGAGLRLDA